MERQLKERLVGAAVLIAVAVVMVPEMFSGSGSHEVENHKTSSSEASDSSESGQLKTYRIDLQQRDTASPTQMAESSSSSRPVSLVDSGQRNVANVNAAHASSSAAHATTPPATPSDGGWSVQLGSFGAEANAKKIVADAKAHGFLA